MIEGMRNHMRQQSELVGTDSVHGALAGIVDDYQPSTYRVRVRLQPDDTLTGWLPIKSFATGNGFGVQFGPSAGDVVDVHFQEGDSSNGFVTLGHFNEQTRPLPVPSGELWMTHKSGSFFRLMNDGTLQAKGDLHVDGDIYDKVGKLDGLRQHYNQHTHSDPQGGSVAATALQDPGT